VKVRYIALTALLLATLLSACMQSEKEVKSEFSYHIGIENTEVLKNATFLLPAPEIITNLSCPSHWRCEIVNTEFGKMVKIEADEFLTEIKPTPIPVQPGEKVEKLNLTYRYNILDFTLRVNQTIDTLNPFNTANIPKFNVREIECREQEDWRTVRCYSFETKIFADYNSSEKARVEINIWFEGRNNWWEMGWKGNEFVETVYVILEGEKHGWIKANGTIVAGKGVY
jgi:hypothetical protein